jgi:glutaminyl-peptide cyclotransferase
MTAIRLANLLQEVGASAPTFTIRQGPALAPEGSLPPSRRLSSAANFRFSAARLVRTACALSVLVFWGCNSNGVESPKPSTTVRVAPPKDPNQLPDEDTPAPEKTGGFDGKRAYADVAKQVDFGPHPAGSQAIAQVQDYILSELSSAGCTADTDAFNAQTPAGEVAMKNILVKIPGERPGIIMLATHYDTKRLDNFVGADDGGSSTAVMLELARSLCALHGRYNVWIAFFDAEEAVNPEWHDPDNRYGSRQMAAKMAISGDITKIRAFLLADIVGTRTLILKRDANSDKALTDLVWATAARLGYSGVFVNDTTAIEDDHQSFSARKVPTVDVIDLQIPYWHTPQDTLDKISSKSLAVVGHVFIESVKQLQTK